MDAFELRDYVMELVDDNVSDALLGFIFGDGAYKNGFQIDIRHSKPQFFYCDWIEFIFADRLKLKKRDFQQAGTFSNARRYDVRQIRITAPDGYIRDKSNFYLPTGRKVLTNDMLNRISDFGLLLWYLDDGSLSVRDLGGRIQRQAYLSTECFTEEEQLKIQTMFDRRFNIITRVHKYTKEYNGEKRLYYRQYFSASEFRNFYDIVRAYLEALPCEFSYKFDMRYTRNRLKSSAEYAEKYNFNLSA